VDIADLDSHQAFLNGAAAVAMLVGPDAPVRLEPERATHMMNTWDFYKPVGWKDSFPLMRDGKHSIDVYMACLEGCYRGLSRKLDTPNLLSIHDYAIFHCTSTYLCKRAFDRLAGLASPELGLRDRNALYQSMAAPGTLLTKQIGSTYTASCYVNLYSLLHTLGEQAVGKKILAFSYGSGAASSMFRLSVDSLPDLGHKLDQRLAARIAHVPQDFIALTEAYSNAYARFDFKPSERSDLKEGVYYLDRVDRWGLRHYSRFANGQKQALCSGSPLERVLYETDAESTMDVVRTEEMPVA
ncbi:MAG: hydroxymethylglutaryl-CoA synthase, partial [Pseudomonadota bacterium]